MIQKKKKHSAKFQVVKLAWKYNLLPDHLMHTINIDYRILIINIFNQTIISAIKKLSVTF